VLTGLDTPYPDSLRQPGFLLDDLAVDAKLWPYWLLDDDSQRTITLRLAEHVVGQRAVIAFSIDSLQGSITATPDSSGYLRIEAGADGSDVLVAYVERIWEEHEIWPPGVAAPIGEESPGRLGKHRSWISMSATGWPVLAAIANAHGWLNVVQIDRARTTEAADK